MLERLTHTPIVVSDQEKALKFYTEVLEFEKRADYQQPGNPRWLTVAPKGEEIELILVQGKSRVDLHLPPEAGTGGYHWALATADCRRDFERLKARGVDFHVGSYTAPQKQAWGLTVAFKDPDGNQFALVQPNFIGKAYQAMNRRKNHVANAAQKLTHVPILVNDQDKALRFYTEVLGFEKRQDYQQSGRPRWLTVALKGQELEFVILKGEYIIDPRPPADKDSGGNHWVLRTNDCQEDVKVFKARGVRFKEPAPAATPFGIAAYFTDLDGNHFCLLQAAKTQR